MNNNNNFNLWSIINIVLIIGFALSFRILNEQGFQDSTGISYIIVILFLFFYILNISNTIFFHNEYQLLDKSMTPEYDRKNNKIIYSGSSVFRSHLDNLSKIYNSMNDGTVNQDNSLEYLANKLSRREYFVQLGSNIMITLGLIGTISGLIISITGLEEVMTSLGEDGTVVVGGLKQALDGMGTAFYTTLFGAVLGGFFLKLLHQSSINIADEVVDEIALKTEIYVIPYLSKTVESNINSQSKLLTNYMEQSQDVLKKETDNIKAYMDKVTSLTSSLESLNKKINEHEENIGTTHLSLLKRIEVILKKIQEDSKPLLKRFFG